jgi:hypothetical protein
MPSKTKPAPPKASDAMKNKAYAEFRERQSEAAKTDGFGGMLDSVCRGCGDWMSEHTGPPCPPVLPGFSTQRPPPWGLARAWSNLCETAEKMRERSESWRLAHAALETKLEALEKDFEHEQQQAESWRQNAIALEGALAETSAQLAEAKLNTKGEHGMRLAAQQRADLLLQALIEIGFERDTGEQMSCRGCGMDMAHIYDADKHGTIYEGDRPGRPCIVGKAMEAAGFRSLASAVAARAKGGV